MRDREREQGRGGENRGGRGPAHLSTYLIRKPAPSWTPNPLYPFLFSFFPIAFISFLHKVQFAHLLSFFLYNVFSFVRMQAFPRQLSLPVLFMTISSGPGLRPGTQ